MVTVIKQVPNRSPAFATKVCTITPDVITDTYSGIFVSSIVQPRRVWMISPVDVKTYSHDSTANLLMSKA